MTAREKAGIVLIRAQAEEIARLRLERDEARRVQDLLRAILERVEVVGAIAKRLEPT